MATYFAGIGGQKCGTSWIARYLYSHPGVLKHPIKEMHVFDWLYIPGAGGDSPARIRNAIAAYSSAERRASLSVMNRAVLSSRRQAFEELLEIQTAPDVDTTLERYRAYFQRRVRPEHVCFGEVTPAYALLPTAAFETILKMYPSARFVFAMRDPVDRLWSAARHPLHSDTNHDPIAHLARDSVIRHSQYELTLAVLDDVIPSNQLFVCFYEDLFQGEATLRKLTDFLGIEYVKSDRKVLVNPGQPAVMPDGVAAKAAQLLAPTYRAVQRRLQRLPRRWYQRLLLADSLSLGLLLALISI